MVPIRQILSQEATQAILAKLKEKGYTATHAFDAALQIAIAEQGDNVPTDGWKGRKSMVFPISVRFLSLPTSCQRVKRRAIANTNSPLPVLLDRFAKVVQARI